MKKYIKYLLIALFLCSCKTTEKPKVEISTSYEIHFTNGAMVKLNPKTGETWMYVAIEGYGGDWVKINEVDRSKINFQMPRQKSNF